MNPSFPLFTVSRTKVCQKAISIFKRNVSTANNATGNLFRIYECRKHCATTASVTVKPFEEIPGPKPLPVIGNVWRYLPGIGNYSVDRLLENGIYNLKTYGEVVREVVGKDRIVHVFDPCDMETVFRADRRYPYRRSHRALLKYRRERCDLYSSGGLFPENGEEWYRFRKLFQQTLLNQENVNAYVEDFESVTEQLIESIKNRRNDKHEVIDFEEDLFLWALENVAIMTLDAKLGSLSNRSEVQPLVKAAHDTHYAVVKTEYSQFELWKYLPTISYTKLCKSQKVMENTILPLLRKKVEKQNESNCRRSIVDQFLQNENTSEKDVFTVIMDLFLAGIDTTSFTCGFALYFLGKNQKIQDAVRDEIKTFLPRKCSKLKPDALNSMHLLKACVKETMRLRPVSIGTGRLTTQDMVLRNYRIPVGTTVITQNQVACRQEQYFRNANSFLPERWLRKASIDENTKNDRNDKWNKPSPFLVLPFGFGPRKCIGRRFAEMEIYVCMAKLLRNFKVEYHYEDIDTTTRLINVADKPMRFTFIDVHDE